VGIELWEKEENIRRDFTLVTGIASEARQSPAESVHPARATRLLRFLPKADKLAMHVGAGMGLVQNCFSQSTCHQKQFNFHYKHPKWTIQRSDRMFELD
jgi:hypothetical protein